MPLWKLLIGFSCQICVWEILRLSRKTAWYGKRQLALGRVRRSTGCERRCNWSFFSSAAWTE